jgi:hypothetical protein
MIGRHGYACHRCGEWHDELPLAYHADAPPMFGWLSTELPIYQPSTLNLKTVVHMQPVGLRPLVELEPTEHPLAVEQREGISIGRVQEFAERILHGTRRTAAASTPLAQCR